MKRNIKSGLLLSLLVVLMSGCGSPLRSEERGLASQAQIRIIADDLIGASIAIGDFTIERVAKEDIERYRFGIAGSSDPDRQRKHVLTIEVDPGLLNVEIGFAGKKVFSEEMYFVKGQLREVDL